MFMRLAIALILASVPANSLAQNRTRNVVLITLDGVRTQEIFGGLDSAVLQSTLGKRPIEKSEAYTKYWAGTPEERRQKLMPFFWGTLMQSHGSIAGNRARGSTMLLTNRHWFSYPGYSEILTGEAHDDIIDSNDLGQNPFPTVLEFLKRALKLRAPQAAVFGSWGAFNRIVEHEPGALTVNAGIEAFEHDDPVIRALSGLQFEIEPVAPDVRDDALTFRFAMAHLARAKPRVMYLALGETDDWAHQKEYERVLSALSRTDRFLQELWTWLQSQPDYRDRTTILMTVDHGRGNTAADWHSHGAKVEGAQYTWLAAIGPDFAKRGEWSSAPTIYANQIAATLAAALGFRYDEAQPAAGKPIAELFGAR